MEIGFLGALTLIFITLKLTGTIAWSWWWILSPLWIIPVFGFVCFVIALGIPFWSDAKNNLKRKK